jgi:hypothetical protein
MDRTLSQHIDNDYEELDSNTISSQRRRHLQDEVKGLEQYQKNHPEEDHDPTPLELYCDMNPDALECRMYDD